MSTWILVCNASTARLFSTDGRHSKLRLVRELSHAQSRVMPAELTTDKAGRGRTVSSGPGVFALPSRTSIKEHEAEAFARELATVLQEGLESKQYSNVALYGPPHFLGLLGKGLSATVTKRLLLRKDSDYTHIETRQLPELLADVHQALEAAEHDRVFA